MSVAYVDTSVLTAIAFDEPGAAALAERLGKSLFFLDQSLSLLSGDGLRTCPRLSLDRASLLPGGAPCRLRPDS